MSAYTEALARIGGGYYNNAARTVGNPGGLGDDGHEVNFFAALIDLQTVANFIASAAGQILAGSEHAGAAQAAADDAQGSADAALAAALQFLPLTVAEIRAFTNNTKFFSALRMLQASESVLLPFASTMTPDMNDGFNRHTAPLTGNVNFNLPTNRKPGHSGQWIFTQNGAGGHTVSFASGFYIPLDSEDVALGPNAVSIGTYYVLAADKVYLSIVGDFVA